MLGELASVELTPRQGMLFAASYIEQVQIPAEFFSDQTYQRYQQVEQFLMDLPPGWATEICSESLRRLDAPLEEVGR